MPRVPLDFSDIQDFEPLPKGEYPVVIEEVRFVEPQVEDKYPYLNVQLYVSEGEFQNRKLWTIWSLSPKALFRMKSDLENLGIDTEDIEIDYDEDTMLVLEPELHGVPAIAVVSQRTWEGRLQNQVDMLRSADAADQPRGKTAPKQAKAPAAAKGKAGEKKARKFR